MNIKYIKDAIYDTMFNLAQDVYENKEEIYEQASEGLLDDDHELVEMNVLDILAEMVEERLED
jgi:hypothetical protein